ncbi:MAG TPA: tRNA epoxyqueuosine(34) reductase QueG [Candidatus Binatia bacterium]|nr:tRNA epoxyqueuosine(34) reductase QueG [Candidatus Binatia bacterium]
MKLAIGQRAGELGFDACQFTSADPPTHKEHFERWLEAGCHGDMGYLKRNAAKRADPQKVLAQARTVITLAVSYFGLEEGAIARYARFTDYHDVMGERLKELSGFVNSLAPDARSLWYVDTGPFLERDLAARAGVGFIGKHTNLISRELGNWFFLAEIITTLEIEPDAPEKNRCGTCTRCISACPTKAISAPYQLDARRCISYLTIEVKGAIPEELRPAIGNRIYGCDDCLQVCPWNRFAREGRMMKPHARADLDTPNLVELLALDEPGFRRRFAGTPMMRSKRRGLLRNVCVALGNTGDETALPALERAAMDTEPLIAEHARWAIDQIHERVAAAPVRS